ncbi:MAG: acyl-CoA thioesterase II [Pseudomonadales bacterium]|nr:acyl-CoA thioesterase II [Pseudomonadales bacterium]
MQPEQLVDLLTLERLDRDLFRGANQDIGAAAVFGGQVLGQALIAAGNTVAGRPMHSLHSYFLRPGLVRVPILYQVERVRDGGSFTTRRVVALQEGEAIFILSASFQEPEHGFSHQLPMPEVPGPEGLPDESELRRTAAERLPPAQRPFLTSVRPVEMRPVAPEGLWTEQTAAPRQQFWVRVPAVLPDNGELHRALLAYASDYYFMGTALRPHGVRFGAPGLQAASLDHAMWFHRDFRIDDWLLYDMASPSASGARGLNIGHFYRRDGVLVASCVQEGLIRQRG